MRLLKGLQASVLSEKKNYSDNIEGSWVFGKYQSKYNFRFIVILNRKRNFLLPIIRQYVEQVIVILTDE